MIEAEVKFKLLDLRAKMPVYGSDGAAGADLCLLSDGCVTIAPGETVMLHTGVAVAIPDGFVGLICARSGIATRRGLAPANKVGVIDADYRGELMIAMLNHSAEPATVEPGERIAQLLIVPYLRARFALSDTLDETARGSGGFGSTGKI